MPASEQPIWVALGMTDLFAKPLERDESHGFASTVRFRSEERASARPGSSVIVQIV